MDFVVSFDNEEEYKDFINLFEREKINKLRNHRLYKIFRGMKERCNNKNHLAYHRYGGRGIKICEEWIVKNGFFHFYNWAIKNGYNDNLSIDRIDNDKGYSPDNCRWATRSQQQHNKGLSKRNKSGYTGVCFCKTFNVWKSYICINRKIIHLGNYKTKEEAILKRKEYDKNNI